MSSLKKVKDANAHNIINVANEIVGKNPMSTAFVTTENNYHRGYDFNGRKNKESATRWDCSELASAVIRETNKDMLKIQGEEWKTDFKKLNNAFQLHSATWHQENTLKTFSPLISNNKQEIKKSLQPGMVVFMKYDGGRHIGVVTKDPKTGGLLIAESIQGKSNIGVIHRSIDKFFGVGKAAKASTKFTLYDPYHLDRDKLNELDKKEEMVRVAYLEAENHYKDGSFRRVSGFENKESFIKDFIKTKFKEEREREISEQKELVGDVISFVASPITKKALYVSKLADKIKDLNFVKPESIENLSNNINNKVKVEKINNTSIENNNNNSIEDMTRMQEIQDKIMKVQKDIENSVNQITGLKIS